MKNNNSILWILGLVVVVVVVIVVLVLVFRKKKSGGGGGGGTAPSIKFSGFAPVEPTTDSPWLLQTSYVVAYIDASYNPINHGPISNVVTVSSATGTNPTFIVTLKDGYDVVVYRTAATDLNTPPTPPDGKGSYFVIVPDKTPGFTDKSNPYSGPPTGPDINSDIVWDTTSKKNPPFRVITYYRLALSPNDSPTDMGAPGKEISAQNLLGYNPTMTFTDKTGGGNNYKTNVFRSSDNITWTAATEIVVLFPESGTGKFTDNANVYYAGPPAILATNFLLATPASVTCDSAPLTNPWGLTTVYTAAFSDYPDSPESCGKMLEKSITFNPLTTGGCPTFTITQPTSVPYYVIVYRTDNGIDPTNLPPPPTTANAILPPYVSGPSWTDNNNPFMGVPQVSFGNPTYNTTSKDTLPFRVSTSVIVTLTDKTNNLVGVSAPVVFSNLMGTYPVKVTISLPKGYLWKVYTMKLQRQETSVGTPEDVQSGEVTFDDIVNPTIMTLNKNPYYTAPPAYSPADFHCNIWDNNKNTCSNTCFPACTDSTQCCTNNQCTSITTYDSTNTALVKNKDNTCIGLQQKNLTIDSIKTGCANDPVNPYFMVTTNHTWSNTGPNPPISPSFDGYCVLQSPVNWSIGTLMDPGQTSGPVQYKPIVADPNVKVTSAFDFAGPPTVYTLGTGYGYGCDQADPNKIDFCHTCASKDQCQSINKTNGFVNDQTACGSDEFALPFQSYDDSGIATKSKLCMKFK